MSKKNVRKKNREKTNDKVLNVALIIFFISVAVILFGLFRIVMSWESKDNNKKHTSGNVVVYPDNPERIIADKYMKNYYDSEIVTGCIACDEAHTANLEVLKNKYKENEQYLSSFEFDYEYIGYIDIDEIQYDGFFENYSESLYISSMEDITELKCLEYEMSLTSDKYSVDQTTSIYLYVGKYNDEWKVLLELNGDSDESFGKQVTDVTEANVKAITDTYIKAEYDECDANNMIKCIGFDENLREALLNELTEYEKQIKDYKEENSLSFSYAYKNTRELTDVEISEFWVNQGSKVYISDHSRVSGVVRVTYEMNVKLDNNELAKDRYKVYIYLGYIDGSWRILAEE